MRGDVTLAPFLVGHRLVRDGVNDIGCVRWSNIPRCLPRAMRAASFVMHLTLSVPVELCDTVAIAAAVFSPILSRKTSEPPLGTFLTRLPPLLSLRGLGRSTATSRPL